MWKRRKEKKRKMMVIMRKKMEEEYIINNTDIGLTSPNADPTMPNAWQGSPRSTNFQVTGMI